MISALMNTDWADIQCKPQRLFRLCFQRRLQQALGRNRSAAVEFGLAWEATLNEVPLADADQGAVYWELIEWARSDDLFTGPKEHALLSAWRGSHEL